jgi:hypothetical protein
MGNLRDSPNSVLRRDGILVSPPVMKTRRWRFPGLALIIFLLGAPLLTEVHADRTFDGRYGEKMKFAKRIRIAFPDFVLEYTGQRRETSEKYPRGFLFYDFKATLEGVSVPFSWSSGTGDIGPASFKVKESSFSLELKHSDKLGPLKEDELVVWKL